MTSPALNFHFFLAQRSIAVSIRLPFLLWERDQDNEDLAIVARGGSLKSQASYSKGARNGYIKDKIFKTAQYPLLEVEH